MARVALAPVEDWKRVGDPWGEEPATNVEVHFARALDVYNNPDEGWEEIRPLEATGQRQLLKTVSPTVSFLRNEYLIDLTVEESINFMRPEVTFHHGRKDFDPLVANATILQLFAPGDVLGWVSLKPCQFWAAAAIVNHAPDASKPGQMIRSVRRRDFPAPGLSCIVHMPVHPETMVMLEQQGLVKAGAYIIMPAPGQEGKALNVEIQRVYRPSDWALALMPDGSTFLKHWASCYKKSKVYQEVQDGKVDEVYLVITLRKCERGPPLIPVDSMLQQWEPCAREAFSLPDYLRRFAEVLGASLEVFDRMDGRHLVPYQACCVTTHWEAVAPALDPAFKAQRTAYRRANGGTGAPVLATGSQPRFVDRPVIHPNLVESGYGATVRHTFLKFDEDREEGRCSSDPGCPEGAAPSD
uniref:Uncharacterized protein n=1 Tax=Oxyrrhis marina TaxID=2969 RepID=A0A7S4GKM9_OXYMA